MLLSEIVQFLNTIFIELLIPIGTIKQFCVQF